MALISIIITGVTGEGLKVHNGLSVESIVKRVKGREIRLYGEPEISESGGLIRRKLGRPHLPAGAADDGGRLYTHVGYVVYAAGSPLTRLQRP